MGELFSIPRGQAGITADWLIGDVRFRPVSERNKEREELWEYFKGKAGKIPSNLYLSGMPPSSFLEHLVDGWTFQDIVEQCQQAEGRFTKAAVSVLYARIKAYRAREL